MNALAIALENAASIRPESHVLRPFNRAEALTVAEAMNASGLPRSTVYWLVDHRSIGRRVAGRVMVSRVALSMLLDGREDLLEAYLSGDRESAAIVGYFERHGIPLPR